MGVAAHGADFSITEKASGGMRAKNLSEQAGVMSRLAKESLAPPGAGKKEGGQGSSVGLQSFQDAAVIFFSGGAVSQLKLEGLSGAGPGTDDDSTALGVGSGNIADQEVTSGEFVPVFIGGQTDEDIAAGAFALLLAHGSDDFVECSKGSLSSKLEDDVFLGTGDGEGLADGMAALTDGVAEGERTGKRDGEAAAFHDTTIGKDVNSLLAVDAAGQPAQPRNAGPGLVPGMKPGLHLEGKRIEQEQPGADFSGRQADATVP